MSYEFFSKRSHFKLEELNKLPHLLTKTTTMSGFQSKVISSLQFCIAILS